MDCPSCQASNPAGAKFCMNCGSALAAACPQCATELPPGAQFCFNCGHKLAEETSAPQAEPAKARIEQYIPSELLAKLESARASGGMQGERRVVTMLFCDVQGSTAAAETLDPEEWAEIMNGAFEHLIAPVYRYEGTLARLMGDAILAFFGAPIAHEDDPQRAVFAALDTVQAIRPYREQVRAQWGIDFNVRIGINTGLVVVGEVGSDLRVEYTALGDAVNLAARMEQAAEPGTVQITENTYKVVAPLFECEDLGGIQVKGKSEPVESYRVLRAKAEPGRLRGIEGLDAPLIGREKELNLLREAVTELRQGRGQLVSVMGEAGLGKSRLIAELHHALVADGLMFDSPATTRDGAGSAAQDAIAWCEGRSLSYETSTPYAPFASLFSRFFGFREEQSDAEKYDGLRDQIAEVAPKHVAEAAPFVATMLGIELTGEDAEVVRYLQPPQLRSGVFKATRDVLERLASTRPLVLVFEDLHWVDPTSLELLEQIMPLTDHVPLMIIGIFRPWRQEPSWRFHEIAARDYIHRYTSVLLDPLNQDSCRELVANLLHVEDLPEKVRSLILTKAEGNPFFVEEVIRSLLDANLVVRENSHWRATREIENIAVPDTLAGVITARLDRLDEQSKRVAQTASVLGREFQFDALANVHESQDNLDEALTDLQRRELVREKSRLPRRVYTFQHAMTQETAYASLLLSRRRELHKRVGTCMEQMEPGRANDIAQHLLEAREEARALPYLVDAGDRAAGAYSTHEAIEFYTQALDILGRTKDIELARRAYEGLGGVLTFAHDVPGAVANYDAMLQLAETEGDMPMQVSALNKLGYVTALMRGQLPEGEKLLVDAERLAHQCDDLSGLAELHMTYCYIRSTTGDFDGAVDHLKDAAQIGRALDVEEPKLFGLTHIANTMIYMTRFEDAWTAIQEARQVAEAAGNRKYLSELLALTTPLYHMRNGELEAARESAEEGTAMAAQIGALENEFSGAYALGQIAWLRGEYERAIEFQQRALQASKLSGASYLQPPALCALGTVYLDISPKLADKTIECHTEAMQVMEQPLGAAMGAISWSEMGFCTMALGDLERADEFFQKGLTTSTLPRLMLRPMLLVAAALVSLGRNDLDEAERSLKDAIALAEAGKMKHYFPLLAFADAQVSSARGDTELALARFASAEELALGMKMRPLVWQARAGASRVLLASGHQEQADAKQEQARSMIDEIAALFQDDGLRAMFVESAIGKLSIHA